jgi:hypothetical protein
MINYFKNHSRRVNPGIDSLKFLENLKSSGVNFALPGDFLVSLEKPSQKVSTLLKHDLHGVFHNVYKLAKQEANAGIFGVYFMMHRHPHNKSYFEEKETWKILREINSMGHSIGLHLDFSEVIKMHGSVIEGVKRELSYFESNGIDIQFMSRHGNTNLDSKIRLCNWIFEDLNQGVEITDLPDFLRSSFETMSVNEFFVSCGIRGTFDHLVVTGNANHLYTNYLTDNSGSWKMTTPVSIYKGPEESRAIGTRFLMPSKVELKVITERLLKYNSMVLVHPQWYVHS